MDKIALEWRKPVKLTWEKGGYSANLRAVAKEPGIYVFVDGQTPIYVGQGNNVQGRLQTYMGPDNHLKEKLPQGRDLVFLPCGISVNGKPLPKFGGATEAILDEAENAMIRFLLANDLELINKAKIKNHSTFVFAESEHAWSPRQLIVSRIRPKAKSRRLPQYALRKGSVSKRKRS